jgi:DNA-binding GntR family transcriptional regulator
MFDRFMPKARSNRVAPVQRQSLAEQVVIKLRHAIITGAIGANVALAEPVLALQFGVSRSPVREGLIQLEREGLIYFDDRGRTRVCTMTPGDFAEISSMRVALESLGAAWAARHWKKKNTTELEKNIRQQERSKSLQELSRLDVDLHEYVMEVAQHGRLLSAWLIIRPQFEMWLAHIHRVQEDNHLNAREITVRAHRRLLKVLAGGFPEAAEQGMRAHVISWAEWLPSQFQKLNLPA